MTYPSIPGVPEPTPLRVGEYPYFDGVFPNEMYVTYMEPGLVGGGTYDESKGIAVAMVVRQVERILSTIAAQGEVLYWTVRGYPDGSPYENGSLMGCYAHTIISVVAKIGGETIGDTDSLKARFLDAFTPQKA